MTALRLLNIAAWGAMLAYMLPGAWASAFGRARYGDPMRMACAANAVVFLSFNVLYLFFPADRFALNTALVLSLFLAIYIMLLGRAYGRGPHL